ncbi:F-box/LRR-repeat protein At4g14103-like isoform X1 [Tripterygium wilfordii]|uniref:F-box/LRR-repeat protein At4g14103-like isoform X1 n=1 Tax=Tripterygium wilfordii TaxID=458696 RepID=UPI0018F8591D|nr:F-box/LRR-repeat protein At4g14103-like isoform X1 [Tripterygium wilfordii]
MDVISALPSMKQQKTIEGPKVSDDKDRISQLPDSLLHHILSFLPTKDAVMTCVLSTRWQDLWMSVTNLDFKCYGYYKKEDKSNNSFTNFVERVLLFHSSNIIRFCLDYGDSLDASRVNSWISAAVRRRVQEFRLSIHTQSVLWLPRNLCTSKMLTELKISASCELKLPSIICLSNLKRLHLLHVTFLDDLSVHRLFSGLPVLEDLRLCSCRWSKINHVTISLPNLRSLALSVFSIFKSEDDCKIKINAENLIFLDCASDLTADLHLDNMPLLANSTIGLELMGGNSKSAHHAVNLFGGLSFVKSLVISKGTLECLYYRNSVENLNLFPTFVNLSTLEVNSKVMSHASGPLMGIIRNAPILESIIIKEVYGGTWNRKPYPPCLEFTLKTCCLLDFDGRPADTLFVKFLLKTAKVLERMTLYCSKYLCSQPKKLDHIMKLLKTVPRGSRNCVIDFIKKSY